MSYIIKPDFSSEETFFLLSTWLNFFAPQTPIYDRPLLVNIPILFDELCFFSEKISKNDRWHSTCVQILEEIKFFIDDDIILKKYYPHIFMNIRKYSYDKKIYYWAQSIRIDLQDYFEHVREECQNIVIAGEIKRKKDLIFLLSTLFTQARYYGFKDKELDFGSDIYFSQKPSEIIDAIFGVIYGAKKRFSCYIKMTGDIGVIRSFIAYSRLVQASGTLKPSGGAIADYMRNSANSIFVLMDIDATSPYIAAEKAYNEVKRNLDIVNFCFSKEYIAIKDEVGVKCRENTDCIVSLSRKSGVFSVQPKKDARVYIGKIIDSFSGKCIPNNLSSSLELFSLATKHQDISVKFISIWMALEAIASSGDGNIIDGMCENLTSILSLNLIPSKIKNIAIQLKKIKQGNLPNLSRYLPNSRTGIDKDDLFMLLRENNSSNQNIFCTDLNCNPYIRYNATVLSNHIKSLQLIRRFIQRDKKLHEFQLRRIYRTRNMLFHSGEKLHSIEYNLEILKYYYILSMYSIFERCIAGKFNSTIEALNWYNLRYQYVNDKNVDKIGVKYILHKTKISSTYMIS